MTFCPFWEGCKHGDKCPRALTEEVEERAVAWWGSQDAPIAQPTGKLNKRLLKDRYWGNRESRIV